MLLYASLLIIVVVLTVLIIKRIQSYWSRKGIFEKRPQFFTGNVLDIVTYKKSWGRVILELYNEFRSKGVKYGGMYFFLKPTFIPLDPEIIKNILVTQFHSFENRGLYHDEEFDPISANIVALEGKKWKDIRATILPTFTTNQRKKMFQCFEWYTDEFKNTLVNYWKNNCSIDVRELSACFTTDLTVSCLLGMDSDCIKNPQNIFFKLGNRITGLTWQKSLTLILAQLIPKKIYGILGLRFTEKMIQNNFLEIAKKTIDDKKKSNITRNDLIDAMLQAKSHEQNKYGINQIAAQCFVAFIAGHETTATVLSFSLYELALNRHVQDSLRSDIESVLNKHNGELSFDSVSEMEYLNGVVLESLRKYPVCPVLLRSCNKKYRVPGTNVTLDKGILVNIPVLGLHMDPKYHPNPESFNPDRFSTENKKRIKECTFLPYGTGPRGCLGYRFGILMAKAAIIEVIRNYNIYLSEETKTPVELSSNSFFITTKHKVCIKLEKLENN